MKYTFDKADEVSEIYTLKFRRCTISIQIFHGKAIKHLQVCKTSSNVPLLAKTDYVTRVYQNEISDENIYKFL